MRGCGLSTRIPSRVRWRTTSLALWMCVAASLMGCPAKQTIPPTTRVGVLPFPISQQAEITRYEGTDEALRQLAAKLPESIAKGFAAHDIAAQVIAEPERKNVDLVVSGEITKIDGGNRALRVLVGMGAGGATCGVTGMVERQDGTRVGSFGIDRKKHSTGFFWVHFGDTADRQVQEIFQSIGQSIADMVIEGRYSGGYVGAPRQSRQTPDPAESPATSRPVDERLRQLEKLRSDGLVTDEEYRARRRAILEQL